MNLIDETNYLNNMNPETMIRHGIPKTLTVRREVIHLKHILTEIFILKRINVMKYLDKIGFTLFDYMSFFSQKMRRVHYFTRQITVDPNKIVHHGFQRFFHSIELFSQLKTTIVLDFDGVVTSKKFRELYELCVERCNVEICSANPSVSNEWFDKNNLTRPNKIHAMKGKVKKIKRLLEISKYNDMMFYVDNETEYLDYVWIFGIKTYHYASGKIKYYSRNSR